MNEADGQIDVNDPLDEMLFNASEQEDADALRWLIEAETFNAND